jgi:hypothetical protein
VSGLSKLSTLMKEGSASKRRPLGSGQVFGESDEERCRQGSRLHIVVIINLEFFVCLLLNRGRVGFLH